MPVVIDGSHVRTSEFDLAIVQHAQQCYAWTLTDERDLHIVQRAEEDARELVSDLTDAECYALEWLAEEAIEHIRFQYRDAVAVYVEDSCLWLEPVRAF